MRLPRPIDAATRLLDGRHHLERFAMEQAGEVDYLITWRDTEFVGRVSLTPCRPTAVPLAGRGYSSNSSFGPVRVEELFG